MTKTKSASDKKKGGKDKDPSGADPKSLGSYTIPKVGQKDSTKATKPKSLDPAVIDPSTRPLHRYHLPRRVVDRSDLLGDPGPGARLGGINPPYHRYHGLVMRETPLVRLPLHEGTSLG